MGCELRERERVAEQYVEGQLCPWEQEDFEMHLLECPKCLERVGTLNEIQMGLEERRDEIANAVTEPAGGGKWLIVTALAIVMMLIAAGWWGLR